MIAHQISCGLASIMLIVGMIGRVGAMAHGSTALSPVPSVPPAEADYDALCEAIMGTARGRWFLAEYARRNRHADTQLVLAAVARVEAVITGELAQRASVAQQTEPLEPATTAAPAPVDSADTKPETAPPGSVAEPETDHVLAVAGRLQDLVGAMRERGLEARTCDQIAHLSSAILSASALRDHNDTRARKLAEVLRLLERRIDSMLRNSPQPHAAPPSPPGHAAANNSFAAIKAMSDEERIALFT
jgi:hypothetical protein